MVSSPLRVLAVIVNYGEAQLNYLHRVVDELKRVNPLRYAIDIVVHTNVVTGLTGVQEVIHVEKPHADGKAWNGWHWMPWACRPTILERKDAYDLYLYTENDHLYKESHFDAFLAATAALPDTMLVGFIQYEEFPEHNKGLFYPAYHANFEWDFNSARRIGEYVIASFSNKHHAGFLVTKKQLRLLLERLGGRFLDDGSDAGTPKVRCCTQLYSSGLQKVIPISHFDSFLIHHLPNKYYGMFKNTDGFDTVKMRPAIQRLIASATDVVS